MKKSNFIALILGTVSGVLFALGMCMTLLPQWNAFTEGIIFGSAGLLLGLVTIALWRKMERKKPIKINAKALGLTLYVAVASLVLGLGMCFCMVWENIILGTIIGLVGILMLLCLIPMFKGLK